MTPVCQALNDAYNAEIRAIIQYSNHAVILEVWGYNKLAGALSSAAREEMGHMHRLAERLVQVGDAPQVMGVTIKQGVDVASMLEADHDAEVEAVEDYNRFIDIAVKAQDGETRALFEEILRSEVKHRTYLEAQLAQIEAMGNQNYLSVIV